MSGLTRFLGDTPLRVFLRLLVLSFVVGLVLSALNIRPHDIYWWVERTIRHIYDMGFAAVEKAFRYFLLGAVIVFPVWLVVRVLKSLGRAGSETLVDQGSRNREA